MSILEQCDQSDLATMCSVSYSWLQQAAPLLYKNVEVDEDGAVKLFCKRVRNSGDKDHQT